MRHNIQIGLVIVLAVVASYSGFATKAAYASKNCEQYHQKAIEAVELVKMEGHPTWKQAHSQASLAWSAVFANCARLP